MRKDQLHYWRSTTQLGCVSQDSYPRKSFLREPGMLGSKHTVKFSKGTWHQIKIRERKGPSRGVVQKFALHGRSLCPSIFGERSHEETLIRERCVALGEKPLQAQEFGQSYVLCSWWSQRYVNTCHFKETRRARTRSRFRSIDAHDEQKKN